MAAVSEHQLHRLSRFLTTSITPGLPYCLASALVITLLLPVYRFIRRDYHDFLALGPGGTPSNFAGYLKVSGLRLFILKDPLRPETPSPNVQPTNGYLVRLPVRPGPRPVVAGIAPQRQVNQIPSPELFQSLRHAIHSFADLYPQELRKGTSCFEKNGLGLFLSQTPMKSCNTTGPQYQLNNMKNIHDAVQTPGHLNRTCGDSAEICHVHATVSTVDISNQIFSCNCTSITYFT